MQRLIVSLISLAMTLGGLAARAAGDTKAEQLLAQARAALGGEKNLAKVQGLSATGTYQREVGQGSLGYVTGTYSHIGGDRFTQVADPDLGTLNLLSFEPNSIGGPLTQGVFLYNPILPSYDNFNLRVGLRKETWDVALYANNLSRIEPGDPAGAAMFEHTVRRTFHAAIDHEVAPLVPQ